VTSNCSPRDNRNFIISVSASSKKAGKSTVASHLVSELGADYGLKVSSGGTHGESRLVTDPNIISTPGTDTGALVAAGAGLVLWVNAPQGELREELQRALSMFPPGGLLVIEGNSALAHVSPDFAVFLMNVPFEDFKPSATLPLEKADLVLVNLSGALADLDRSSLESEIRERATSASIYFYDEGSRAAALAETIRLVRSCRGHSSWGQTP
jgi:hypothetical protein